MALAVGCSLWELTVMMPVPQSHGLLLWHALQANVDARVILASTHFHNSDTFLEEVEREGGDCRDDVTMRDSDVGGHPIQNHTVRSRFRGE